MRYRVFTCVTILPSGTDPEERDRRIVLLTFGMIQDHMHPDMRRTRRHIGLLFTVLQGMVLTGHFATAEERRLTLEEAVNLARENHENALMATERVEQAENARIRARAAFIPVLTASGAYTHSDKEIEFNNRVIQKQDSFAGAASLIVTLFRGPIYPAAKRAHVEAESARSRAAWDRNLVAFQTAEAYFSVLSSESLVAAAKRNRTTALELLDAVKARREAGEALGVDQTRAELQVVAAEESWFRAKKANDSAMDYLAFLIDRPLPLTLTPVEVRPTPQRAGGDLVETAVDNRPDLKSAEQEVQAADLGVKEGWMDFLPSLSASGNYRLSQNTGWSGDIDSWNIIVTLDWILYDGGLRRAKRRDLSSELQMAKLRKRLLERQIGLEVRQALRSVSTAEAILKTARETLRLAQINQEAVRARYNAGLATSLEVVEADDDLTQAEIGAVVEELSLSIKGLDLLKSLGLDPMGKEIAR